MNCYIPATESSGEMRILDTNGKAFRFNGGMDRRWTHAIIFISLNSNGDRVLRSSRVGRYLGGKLVKMGEDLPQSAAAPKRVEMWCNPPKPNPGPMENVAFVASLSVQPPSCTSPLSFNVP